MTDSDRSAKNIIYWDDGVPIFASDVDVAPISELEQLADEWEEKYEDTDHPKAARSTFQCLRDLREVIEQYE